MAYNDQSANLELSSSQYFSIADASQTGLDITGDFSVEFWINFEQLPSDVGVAMSIAEKTLFVAPGYSVQFRSDDKLMVNFWDSSSNRTRSYTTNATVVSGEVGKWVHYAVTVDVSGPTIKFYKNAVEDTAVTNADTDATSVGDNTTDFSVGKLPGVREKLYILSAISLAVLTSFQTLT